METVIASGQLRVTLSSLGAAAGRAEVFLPGEGWRTVSLSPFPFEAQAEEPSLAGRCVAPCCGRIRRSEIRLNGQLYSLRPNEGPNQLHGGPGGASWKQWALESAGENQAEYALSLADGEDGWPGNRRLRVHWQAEDSSLTLRWQAESDRPAFVDLTSHLYWDLSGRFDGSALGQRLTVGAAWAVENDDSHLPRRLIPAEGTPLDFRSGRSFEELQREFPEDHQLQVALGWNNALLLQGQPAVLEAPDRSLRMEITTDQPAMVVYTGGFLDEKTRLAGDKGAVPGCGVALECQQLPDIFHFDAEKKAWQEAPVDLAANCGPGKIASGWIRWSFGG